MIGRILLKCYAIIQEHNLIAYVFFPFFQAVSLRHLWPGSMCSAGPQGQNNKSTAPQSHSAAEQFKYHTAVRVENDHRGAGCSDGGDVEVLSL